MKRYLLLSILLVSCSTSDDDVTANPQTPTYKNVNYVTITNENTGGGSQFVYLKSGISESSADICYCEASCSKEVIVVSDLQFDQQSLNFRFKKTPSDNYTTRSSIDWCTRFQ